MFQDWTSNRPKDERAQILELSKKNYVKDCDAIFSNDFGFFWIEETFTDSFGPFATLEECVKSLSEYAKGKIQKHISYQLWVRNLSSGQMFVGQFYSRDELQFAINKITLGPKDSIFVLKITTEDISRRFAPKD